MKEIRLTGKMNSTLQQNFSLRIMSLTFYHCHFYESMSLFNFEMHTGLTGKFSFVFITIRSFTT